MNRLIAPLLIGIAFLFAACWENSVPESNSNSVTNAAATKDKSGVRVKIDGEEEIAFKPSSTWATHWEKTSSYPKDGRTVTDKTAHTTVILANYDMDTKDGKMSIEKQKLEKLGQVRIKFAFMGEKDTDYETPVKAGAYKIKPGDFLEPGNDFNMIDGVTVNYFMKEAKETSFADNKMTGTLNIIQVKDGMISGEIDVSDGKHSIKGKFSSKR